MKKTSMLSISIFVICIFALFTSQVKALAAIDVGIWYSTWYSKLSTINTDWITNFGGSSLNQFVGDVNNDGKEDAVTFNGSGIWNIAISNGNGFNAATQWISGHGTGSTEQFLSDVNGDGKADAVVYFNTDASGDSLAGDWYVALSSGTGFQASMLWKSGAGTTAAKRLVADASGDGKADIVIFESAAGTWRVAPSSGSAFGTLTQWTTGHGVGSNNQFMGDINKDGKLDSLVYFNSGDWYAAPSTGTGFGSYSAWTSGHGYGSVAQYVSDGNGDGYADTYVYFNADVGPDGLVGDLIGREYDRTSKASTSGNMLVNTGFGYLATKLMQGNVTGDEYKWKATVAFYAGTGGGTWKVQRYKQADTVATNTWLGFPTKPAINYRPLTLGSYQTYDSGDNAVIDEHLATIAGAGIDWLLMDETNGLNNVGGAILNRARKVAERIKVWNDNPSNRDIKYAFAVGLMQGTNDPLSFEQEAGQVWDEFANDAAIGGSSYHYQLNGKPLLILYGIPDNQTRWINYTGSKANTDHFTVRFASNASAGEYGWQLPPTGTVDNNEVMNVMPGWNNNSPGYIPVSRQNGYFYTVMTWDKIIDRATKPQIVVINSFNEFAEETGVQIADTSLLVGPAEKWYNSAGVIDNSMYWNYTKNYIKQLRNPTTSFKASTGFSSTQGTNGWRYEEWKYVGATRTINTMTWDAANSRWKGTATYSLAGSNWQHPEIDAQSVRKFTVPSAGSVTIAGNAAKQTASGDGVKIKIKKNDADFWPAGGGYVTITSTAGYNVFVTTTVNANDQFQFIVDRNGTIADDTTIWNPTITYN